MANQTIIEPVDYVPTVFNFSPAKLTDEQFESLCRNHPDPNLEMSAVGELIIVPPTLPYTGEKNADLIFEVSLWARKDKTGVVFDSSSLFTFPNGAKRSRTFLGLHGRNGTIFPKLKKNVSRASRLISL